jgi:regulatory associated protein of mTOR
VLCLNIDVDPPDVVKTNPCAILECWVDPHTMPSHKALEAIGTNLQHQFEGLSPKISYKPILDPSYEDLRRFCVQLRKQAKEDTAMFYYNGHGVPRPTASGELWCFNRNYTQYIPVSLQEVQSWLGSPCIYIWDCSAAGHLLQNFKSFAEKRDAENNMKRGGYPDGMAPFMDSIQLAACAANETLPSSPELPADLFTSCLTSPIDIALRFFVNNHHLPNNLTADEVMQLPGDLKDRRTPLGELNWIFTAITDTIAWTTFSRDVFTRLYRSDLLIASLFRNFLLAERIMKNYHCTPHTYPPLPPTNTHPLWASWDLAVDACLRQLDNMLRRGKVGELPIMPSAARARRAQATTQSNVSSDLAQSYIPSRFFADQLTAFEVWIARGGSALTKRGPMSLPLQQSDSDLLSPCAAEVPPPQHLIPRKPPEQLPIVLQILLSQPHRLRALILLSQFVDLGPWAVNLALTIGIFPYISKLLQAAGPELRPVLIFIWARILAVDPMSQTELVNNQGYKYFANILALREEPRHQILPNKAEHKAMCAFILGAIARGHPAGQHACFRDKVFDQCIVLLNEGDFLLRQWVALCIAQLWDANDDIRVYGVDTGTQDKLLEILQDDSPEVRAAALYALGTFLGASGSPDASRLGGGGSGSMSQLEERTHFRMETAVVTAATLTLQDDASPMVKKELIVLASCLVKEWRGHFVICAWIHWEEDERKRRAPESRAQEDEDEDDVSAQALAEWLDNFAEDEQLREENRVLLSSFYTIFCALLEYSVDPYPEVAANAQTLVDYIMALLLASPFTKIPACTVKVPHPPPATGSGTVPPSPVLNGFRSRVPSLTSLASTATAVASERSRPQISRADSVGGAITSSVSNTLKRASSVASALRGLAGGVAFPSIEDAPPRSGATTPARHERQDLSRPPSPNLNLARYTSPYARSPERGGARTRSPSPAASDRSAAPASQTPQFGPSDVMEALMEEDFERLRARRRTGGSRRHAQAMQGGLASPVGSTHSMDSSVSEIVGGLGTGVGLRDSLPLKSRFWDWCAEYFKEPQMRVSCSAYGINGISNRVRA